MSEIFPSLQSFSLFSLDIRRPFPALKQFSPTLTPSRFLQSTSHLCFLFILDTSSTSPPSNASSSITRLFKLLKRFTFSRSRLRHPCSGNTNSESPVISTKNSLLPLLLSNTSVWRSLAAPSSKSSSSIVQPSHNPYPIFILSKTRVEIDSGKAEGSTTDLNVWPTKTRVLREETPCKAEMNSLKREPSSSLISISSVSIYGNNTRVLLHNTSLRTPISTFSKLVDRDSKTSLSTAITASFSDKWSRIESIFPLPNNNTNHYATCHHMTLKNTELQ